MRLQKKVYLPSLKTNIRYESISFVITLTLTLTLTLKRFAFTAEEYFSCLCAICDIRPVLGQVLAAVSRSSTRLILPEIVLGKVIINSISRGYL